MRTMVFVIALLFLLLVGCSSTALFTKVSVRERPDSILVHTPPLQISAPSDSLSLVRSPLDSSAVRSLTAVLDTMVGGTRVRAEYRLRPHPYPLPEGEGIDSWSMKISAKDTMVHWMEHDSIIEKPYEVEVVPFWAKAVLVLAIIALLIALLKK